VIGKYITITIEVISRYKILTYIVQSRYLNLVARALCENGLDSA
jgi:hypothetical protein